MPPPGRTLQLAAAIGAAAVMAIGIVAFGWPTFTVLALYWLENVIVGAFAALRIVATGARAGRWIAALATVGFFSVHYGLFCLIHGFFVAVLFGGIRPAGSGIVEPVLLMIDRVAGDRTGLIVIAAMTVAAATDAWRAVAATDHEHPQAIRDAMSAPYGRIVVLHLVLIGGGFLVQALKLPSLAALLLVGAKLAHDLRQLRRQEAPLEEARALNSGGRR
jgi:hypothetical protein